MVGEDGGLHTHMHAYLFVEKHCAPCVLEGPSGVHVQGRAARVGLVWEKKEAVCMREER